MVLSSASDGSNTACGAVGSAIGTPGTVLVLPSGPLTWAAARAGQRILPLVPYFCAAECPPRFPPGTHGAVLPCRHGRAQAWPLNAKQTSQMIRRIVFISAALLLGLLGDFRGAAAQSCVVQAARYNLSADSVDWSIKITSGRSCVGGVRFGNVEIEGVKLVSRPQFGQVVLEGPGFRYTSKPNYSGPDSFSLAVVGRINKVPGNSTIHVTVAVGNSSASSNPTSRTPSKDITPPSKAICSVHNAVRGLNSFWFRYANGDGV